jgi:hypothetical protein
MEPNATPQQNWFANRKWGIFIHYLYSCQNGSGNFHNTKTYQTDWNECVEELDTDLLARQLAEINAGYLIFTVMQGSRFLCAPNETYEKLTGYARGEATCHRDLIGDLLDSLDKYNIPLFLYYTGDGPHKDPKAMLGLYGEATDILPDGNHVTMHFVKNWTAVMQEYAKRYGKRIAGWWVDGLYPTIGYTPELMQPYRDVALEGNPEMLFSANYHGCFKYGNHRTVDVPGAGEVIFADFFHEVAPPTPVDDFTAGEVVSLDAYPTAQLTEGAQSHILSFLGIPNHPAAVYDGWGARGCKYSIEYLMKYVKQVNTLGGVVSMDVCMYRDGRIDPDQLRVLKMLAGLRRAPGL